MRADAIAAAVVGAALAVACGTSDRFAAPPSTELEMAVTLNPSATGGMRSSTVVSAMLVENERFTGGLQRAEFTVFDAQGAVLARETVSGPVAFGPERMFTVRQVLAWTPADVRGRSLNLRLHVGPAGAAPIVIDRTVTF